MLRHVVLFQLRDDASAEAVDAAIDGLGALRSLEAVVAISLGRDAGLAEGNADLVLIVDTIDEAGWRAYQADPTHVRVVAELMRPIVAGRTAAQLEV